MKTILLSIAASSVAGALSGCGCEAIALRHTHAQGLALPLTDFAFEIIYAATFGVMGCLLGLIVGTALYWFKRRAKLRPVSHWLPTPWTRIFRV